MTAAPPPDPVAFAERVLAVLDTGRVISTYKYAVLLSLVDRCRESARDDGLPPARISARAVSDGVLALYWPQAAVHPGSGAVLRQMQRRQADQQGIVGAVAAHRASAGHGVTLAEAERRDPLGLARLREDVWRIVVRNPIPRLQRVGSREDRFLYDYAWKAEAVPRAGEDDLVLAPGTGELLVRLGRLLRPLVQQRWQRQVARENGLEESDLDRFLFGVDRVALARLADPLRELQAGRCFYCDGSVGGGTVEVDHVLPWSRTGEDGLDNLVLADRRCNAAKRDLLPGLGHAARWIERNEARDLDDVAAAARWPRRSRQVTGAAHALYRCAPDGTPLWVETDRYKALDSRAVTLLLRRRDLAAAPPPEPYG